MSANDGLLAELRDVVGQAHVLADPELRRPYEVDWTGRFAGRASVVVRPADVAEVTEVVARCARHGVAIVPQGGNTGLVGGSVPHDGEVVLSLRRLDRCDPVDVDAAQVTAGAGVTLAELQAHVREAGLELAVDLAARDSATIGGMVATNAGGARAFRHGCMRAQLVGVEAVLADGRVVRHLDGLLKDNTGYDLAGLLAGSEGTLAVVTAARLRLVPRRDCRVTALLALGDLPSVVATLRVLRDRVPSLEAAELMTAEGVALVGEHLGVPLPFDREHAAYLLVECAAADEEPLDELAQGLETVAGILADEAVAVDPRGRERLWRYREAHTEAIAALGTPLKLDVAVPLGALADFLARVPAAAAEHAPQARVVLFGHAGDGNVHVNVVGPGLDETRADALSDAVLRLTASLGGSISAEHGIGVAKARWLHLARSDAERDVFAAIRRAMDPGAILNPRVLAPGR